MKSKVVVFGSFVVDLMARTPHLPKPAETVKGSYFQMGAGGKGFNQGIAAHKAGADVAMVTKLGRDAFADVAHKAMDEVGLSKEHLLYNDEVGTGAAIIMVDETTSQNEIVIVPGSCSTITMDEVAGVRNLLKEAAYVLLQLEVNEDANEAVIRLAKECDCKVILNTAPAQPVKDSVFKDTYMVTPNEVEAEMMTGVPVTDEASAKKAAEVFFRKGVEVVVITLGSRGAYIATKQEAKLIPAFKVKAVDTTGAGDAFNGGLLAALAEGKELFEAGKFASALAALSVQKLGTTPSMPKRAEIDAFLEKEG